LKIFKLLGNLVFGKIFSQANDIRHCGCRLGLNPSGQARFNSCKKMLPKLKLAQVNFIMKRKIMLIFKCLRIEYFLA